MPHRVIKFKRVGKTEKTAVGPVSAGRSAQTQTAIISDICHFFFRDSNKALVANWFSQDKFWMTTWTQSFNLNVRARFPALTWRRRKEADNLRSD